MLERSVIQPKMEHVKQVNRQTTIVNICKKGPVQTKRKRKRRRRRTRIIRKTVFGDIFQKKNAPAQVYFRAIDLRPAATVLVRNDSNCIMEATLQMKTKNVTFTIEHGQQVALVVPSIRTLSIVCEDGESNICRSSYTITYNLPTVN